MFAILTDGFENASRQFSAKDVRERIEHQTGKYNWNFRFLAANQDAVLAGRKMGLSARACCTIQASEVGMHEALKRVYCACVAARNPAGAAQAKMGRARS